MRMVNYYAALALVLVPALIATAATGLLEPGSRRHLTLGLFSAITCVALQTLLILFMIVTGRVLKAAVAARSLSPAYLERLNDFFARRRAYPMALLVALLTTTTAVLGYGELIGVPALVHGVLGVATVIANLLSLPVGVRTLRSNQVLLDDVAAELDRLDASGPEHPEPPPPEPWAFSPTTRWAIFAVAAWLPYLYWGLVVWRGRFGEIPLGLPLACAAGSLLGLSTAWRRRRA